MNKRHGRRGVVPLPPGIALDEGQAREDERQAREDAALADIEDRVARGVLSPADADRELVELVFTERFGYLPPDAFEALRRVGLELLEEPEVEESRVEYEATSTRRGDE